VCIHRCVCAYSLSLSLSLTHSVSRCVRACLRAYVLRCVCVCVDGQLDIMGCAASQDAMNDKDKTSNGQYSDEGVFGAEEDFPLYIDEVSGRRVWGGVRVKNQRQTKRGGQGGVEGLRLRSDERCGDPRPSRLLHHSMYCMYIEAYWAAPMGSWGVMSGLDTGGGSRCRIAWRGARWLIAKMISGTTALAALAQITLVLVPRLARTPVRSRSLALAPSLPCPSPLPPFLSLSHAAVRTRTHITL